MPADMNQVAVEMLFKQYSGYKGVRFVAGRNIAFVDFSTTNQAEVAIQALQGFRISHNYDLKLSFAN